MMLKQNLLIGALSAAALSSATVRAGADDGGIAYGGSPGMLASHPSISMAAEKVVMVIGQREVHTVCDFAFTNHGKACKVRMGFPDFGYQYDPESHWGDVEPLDPSTFTSFVSYVNGKLVKTRLIRAKEMDKYWHAKTVSFAAGQTLHVRDVYVQDIGGGDASIGGKSGNVFEAMYVLHTGSSWHGIIGRCEVVVQFKNKRVTRTPRLAQLKGVGAVIKELPGRRNPTEVIAVPSNMIVWTGPCKPIVSGRTLRFVRNNFKPSEKDDINLFFGYRVSGQTFSEAMGYDKPSGRK